MNKIKSYARWIWENGAPWVLGAYLIYSLYLWYPVAQKHYAMEKQTAAPVRQITLTGTEWNLEQITKPALIVFWATWCGPCHLELFRIQKLVSSGALPAQSVLAISSERDEALVRKTVSERGYTFPVALDPEERSFAPFAVTGFPTLVVLGVDNKIEWMTSGLSPTLEIKLRRLFAPRRD